MIYRIPYILNNKIGIFNYVGVWREVSYARKELIETLKKQIKVVKEIEEITSRKSNISLLELDRAIKFLNKIPDEGFPLLSTKSKNIRFVSTGVMFRNQVVEFRIEKGRNE